MKDQRIEGSAAADNCDLHPEPKGADREPALVAPEPRFDPGPTYAAETRRFQGIPGIERAPGGRQWAVWYAGGPDEGTEGPGNYVVLVTSGDGGRSWSGPRLVIDPPGAVRAYDPCLWTDPSGKLWLFWAQCYSAGDNLIWDGRAGVWAMVNEQPDRADGKWSAPRRLCDGVMMNKPTVLASGEWLLPAAIWRTHPSDLIPEALRVRNPPPYGSGVQVSRDQGRSWSFLGRADAPQTAFDEHMVVQRRDGSLWMLIRTSYGIGESVSTDGGRTWSAGRPSGIPHVNARFFIRRLRSGRLLLVSHRPPDGKSRSHLTALLSEDDGKTWTGGLLLDERAGVSYPDGFESPDGRITVIYDRNRRSDREILTVSFTEADVLAGGGSLVRAVVSRPMGPVPGS